jgi:hypothetical protein
MAVIAGVVFTVRALLALFPALTVGFPIKKWSAAAALAAALFYLLLSGAAVATQRSFFITAVALIVALVDRRATLANSINVSPFSYFQTVFIGLSSAWHDARFPTGVTVLHIACSGSEDLAQAIVIISAVKKRSQTRSHLNIAMNSFSRRDGINLPTDNIWLNGESVCPLARKLHKWIQSLTDKVLIPCCREFVPNSFC